MQVEEAVRLLFLSCTASLQLQHFFLLNMYTVYVLVNPGNQIHSQTDRYTSMPVNTYTYIAFNSLLCWLNNKLNVDRV